MLKVFSKVSYGHLRIAKVVQDVFKLLGANNVKSIFVKHLESFFQVAEYINWQLGTGWHFAWLDLCDVRCYLLLNSRVLVWTQHFI